MAFLYLRNYLELVRMEYQISVVEREIAIWKEKCDELLEEIEYLSSDEYVEKMAREKLGLVKPGEIQFIVTDPSAADESSGGGREARSRPFENPRLTHVLAGIL